MATTTEVYLAIYDLSGGTAQQLSTMFLGPENSIPMVPHTGIVAYNNEYFFSSAGVNHQNPTTFRNTHGGMQPVEVKLIGNTTKTQLEFENWLYVGNDVPLKFHGSRYKLLEHNCNTFSDYALRVGFSFGGNVAGVPDWILDLPSKVMRSPFGSMIASSMENMQPFGNENNNISSSPITSQMPASSIISPPVPQSWQQNTTTGSIPATSIPPVPPSWQQNSLNNITISETNKMKVLSATIQNTPMLDSHDSLLLSKDASSFTMCVKKLRQSASSLSSPPEQIQALEMLETNFKDRRISSVITSCVVQQALGPFFSLDEKKEESSSSIVIRNESDILYSFMVLRVLLLQNNPSYDLSPFIEYIIQMLTLSNTNLKESTRSMAWCTLSNTFSHSHHWKHVLSSKSLDDLSNAALQDIIVTTIPNVGTSLKQSSSTFVYNLIHTASLGDETYLPDWCVNIVCNIGEEIESEFDLLTQTRRIVILGKIIQKSCLGRELVKDIGLLCEFDLDKVRFEKNRNLVKEVVTCIS